MGSPPQTTTTNTRHTPPNNNYYNHSQHHQQQHQPSQPSQLAESTSQPSHTSLAPASLPRAPAPGCVLWLHLGQRQQVTSSPATANQQATATQPQPAITSSPDANIRTCKLSQVAQLATAHNANQRQQYGQRGGNGQPVSIG